MALLLLAVARWRPGLGAGQVGVFYALPLAIATVLGLVLKSGRETRINFALLLVCVGTCLFTAEVVSTAWVTRGGARGTTAPAPSVRARVLSLRDGGTRAYPTIPGNVLVDRDATLLTPGPARHPITTVPGDVTAVLCTRPQHTVEFTSDRYGFNNPDSVWDGEADVLLIGDSYTQGVCVQSRDQIAPLLRSRYRVLNLGNKGSGPLQELATLREYGALKQPPIVLWIFYEGNDLYDLRGEVSRTWLTNYLDPDHRQGLAADRTVINSAYSQWIDSALAVDPGGSPESVTPASGGVAERLRLTTLRRMSGVGIAFPSRTSPISVLPEVLARARDDVRAWGGELYLVYLPDHDRYASLLGGGFPGRREVIATARSLDLPLLDLDPIFRAIESPTSLWNGPRGHLTPDGYRLVANSMMSALDTRAEEGRE